MTKLYELNGVKLACPDWVGGPHFAEKLAEGHYESHEARAAVRRVKKGDKILELGAGLGYIGSLCAAAAGAENVTSVEAHPDMLPVIRANFDRNGAQAARLLHGAVVGDDYPDATLAFKRARQFWSSAIAAPEDAGERVVEVPALKISDLLRDVRPNVVIMDVEGAEQYLFEKPWPRHVRVVMMELHPRRYPGIVIKQITDCMSASGLAYDPFASRGTIIGFWRVGKGKPPGKDS